jgi:hypothetical protein
MPGTFSIGLWRCGLNRHVFCQVHSSDRFFPFAAEAFGFGEQFWPVSSAFPFIMQGILVHFFLYWTTNPSWLTMIAPRTDMARPFLVFIWSKRASASAVKPGVAGGNSDGTREVLKCYAMAM